MDHRRYRPTPPLALPDRTWPNQVSTAAPTWCSVDLRDGNQALAEPMGLERKLLFFETLVAMGFKEIEVGFPAASQTDFDFVRTLINEDRIPADVFIQVLTQAREHLITRTLEALKGAKRVIVHLSTCSAPLNRRVVFGLEKEAILAMALQGTRWVKEGVKSLPETLVRFEYGSESFMDTEVEFAAEVADAVVEAWNPRLGEKIILNLPATVEVTGPHHYADRIEWMHRNLKHRDKVVLSLHAHNDRGCAVAATELALLAGAERVEGTLFGNGERTGNADIVTVALNLYTHGVDPGLDLHDLPALARVFEQCNRLPLPARHPYAGELVFTAFSGSHQDAIQKGLAALQREQNPYWEVPYLPIDPTDLGRHYQPIIRINSQSGKSGVAFVLQQTYGFTLPRELAAEFSQVVQRITDASGEELEPEGVYAAFERKYLQAEPWSLVDFKARHGQMQPCELRILLQDGDQVRAFHCKGSTLLEAFLQGLRQAVEIDASITVCSEHFLGTGESAIAVTYVQLRMTDGRTRFGVGLDRDITAASLRAVLSAVNGLSDPGEKKIPE